MQGSSVSPALAGGLHLLSHQGSPNTPVCAQMCTRASFWCIVLTEAHSGKFFIREELWVSSKRNKISIDCGKQRSEGPAFPITAVFFHMYLIISGPSESFVCEIPALNVVIHHIKVHLKECASKAVPILLP